MIDPSKEVQIDDELVTQNQTDYRNDASADSDSEDEPPLTIDVSAADSQSEEVIDSLFVTEQDSHDIDISPVHEEVSENEQSSITDHSIVQSVITMKPSESEQSATSFS